MVEIDYRIALKFHRSLISRNLQILERFAKLFQRKFLHFCIDSSVHRPTIYRFGTSRAWMDSIQGPKLPDPQGAFSKQVPSFTIFAANSEVAVLQPSSCAKVGEHICK